MRKLVTNLATACCALALTGLTACATDGQTASVPSSFVEAEFSAFTAQYGAPTQVESLEDGSVIARFHVADNRTPPRSASGSYTPRMERPRIPNGTQPQFIGSAHGEGIGSGASISEGGWRYQQCVIDVTIDANGLIQVVETDRETCNHISR